MAVRPSVQTVQIANVDLGPERQKLLRERLGGFFAALAKRARAKKRLVYTVNAEDAPLDTVLRLNPEADALFTGFAYDRQHSEAFKQAITVHTPEDLLQVAPELRYPVLAEYLRHAEQGGFRHRRLFLVGDIYAKVGQFLRSALPVHVTFYTDPERTQVSRPVQVTSTDRLDPDPQAELVEGRPIPVGWLHSLQVADIAFHGLVNMPEEGNRFVFKDHSVVDTARKLYLSEGLQAQLTRAQLAEEKLTFVRGKKVFIVLEPDLEHVIAERFVFDRMERLYRHHSLEEARETLERGKSQGIVDYFENAGYDLVFELLEQDERDKLLLAVLGDRLTPHLLGEIEAVRPHLASLEDDDLESLLYHLPQEVVDETLEALKEKNYERFLAQVPPKIREGVILEFLRNRNQVLAAWRGIDPGEQKQILSDQAHLVHAMIYLLDSAWSNRKFPGLKFEFQRSYNSAMLAKMGREEQQAAFHMIARNMEAGGVPKGLLAANLQPAELERFMVEYVSRNPEEFYNRLNPLVRKQIWLTVGQTYREQIARKLHALDKLDILKGNRDTTLGLLFANPRLTAHLNAGEDGELNAQLFLALKKLDKRESKSALLKQVLTAPEWRARRVKGVPALLTDPDNGLILEKLAEHVEALEFRFDSLVCTRAHYEALQDAEPLAGAVVTLVDDLVDASLYHLFQRGDVSREEYDRFSRSVEEEIAKLRRSLAARQAEDPVGVYVLETMQMLNRLGAEAMAGRLSEDALERIDERLDVRTRLLDSLREHLRRIDDFLERAGQQGPRLAERIEQAGAAAEKQAQAAARAHEQAAALVRQFQQVQQRQARAEQDKRKVALTQKELSVQFFEIIQPLILDKVRALGGSFKKLMRLVGVGGAQEDDGADKRVIFKFSDEEIANILRYRIVFCARDPVLAQFVATCLRIDKLEDSLFTLATAETLPHKSDIDILFYGPGYSVEDFSDTVKEHRMVPFADEAFYERLKANERLKAQTKTVLTQADKALGELRPRLQAANEQLKAQQARRRQIAGQLAHLREEHARLEANVAAQRERRHHIAGEMELVEQRLGEVDERFDALKQRLGPLLGGDGGQARELLADGQSELAGRLRDELVAINRELARMMYIKGVKDAGESISRTTQDEILRRLEAREVYRFAQRPFKKLIVADDGSNVAQNLKRVFLGAALPYFKLPEMGVQEVSLRRMLALAENGKGGDYPFVALFSDCPPDDYGELKLVVRKIRNQLPHTYQLLVTPYGEPSALDADGVRYGNLLALKEHCTLVNASIGAVDEPAGMLRVLREKAPLS